MFKSGDPVPTRILEMPLIACATPCRPTPAHTGHAARLEDPVSIDAFSPASGPPSGRAIG